jgi:hypothetical protein
MAVLASVFVMKIGNLKAIGGKNGGNRSNIERVWQVFIKKIMINDFQGQIFKNRGGFLAFLLEKQTIADRMVPKLSQISQNSKSQLGK